MTAKSDRSGRCSFRTCTWACGRPASASSSISCGHMTPRRSTWSATSSMAGGSPKPGTGRPSTTCWSQILLDKADARHARSSYLPGNHDEFLREYLGTYFGEVEFVDRTVHTTAHGKTYLVIHGDQFDVVVDARQVARPCRRLGLSRGAPRQHRHQLGAAPAGPALLVAERLGQAQGQERRLRHRPLRGGAVARGARNRASTASSAATSTLPTCTTGWASTTSTPATGWKAAPPSSRRTRARSS